MTRPLALANYLSGGGDIVCYRYGSFSLNRLRQRPIRPEDVVHLSGELSYF